MVCFITSLVVIYVCCHINNSHYPLRVVVNNLESISGQGEVTKIRFLIIIKDLRIGHFAKENGLS